MTTLQDKIDTKKRALDEDLDQIQYKKRLREISELKWEVVIAARIRKSLDLSSEYTKYLECDLDALDAEVKKAQTHVLTLTKIKDLRLSKPPSWDEPPGRLAGKPSEGKKSDDDPLKPRRKLGPIKKSLTPATVVTSKAVTSAPGSTNAEKTTSETHKPSVIAAPSVSYRPSNEERCRHGKNPCGDCILDDWLCEQLD